MLRLMFYKHQNYFETANRNLMGIKQLFVKSSSCTWVQWLFFIVLAGLSGWLLEQMAIPFVRPYAMRYYNGNCWGKN